MPTRTRTTWWPAPSGDPVSTARRTVTSSHFPKRVKPSGGWRYGKKVRSAARPARVGSALLSLVDPRTYIHGFRLLHYYSYSHVRPRRQMTLGAGARLAPNVSIVNGMRVSVGAGTKIGAHCSLWAGDEHARIEIGARCSFGPGVFVTASNYRFVPGQSFREQPRDEADVVIGDDVWIGAGAFVTAGVVIGDGCVVGAHAVVTRSLPAGAIAVGVPAHVVGNRAELAPA